MGANSSSDNKVKNNDDKVKNNDDKPSDTQKINVNDDKTDSINLNDNINYLIKTLDDEFNKKQKLRIITYNLLEQSTNEIEVMIRSIGQSVSLLYDENNKTYFTLCKIVFSYDKKPDEEIPHSIMFLNNLITNRYHELIYDNANKTYVSTNKCKKQSEIADEESINKFIALLKNEFVKILINYPKIVSK